MTKVALLNVKYSPNLGDGVIAECLESELARVRPDWQVSSVDLAGREEFGTGLDSNRGRVLKALDSVPSFLRGIGTIAALITLIELKYRGVWRRQLKGSEGAIIGGGQLFADSDLNFPLKLNAAINEAGLAGARLAVFGVGVAGSMSKNARRLFLNALSHGPLAHVAVRDSASRYSWNRHFARAGLPGAQLCSDPGLLAGDIYSSKKGRAPRDTPRVGIGIVNPRTLDLHSADDDDFSVGVAQKFWADLASALLERGLEVCLFTNGPHDDEQFVDCVLDRIDDVRVQRAERPRTPSQLAELMQDFDTVVAHRLHANIIAYAFRIPHVGLSWDPKVDAFFGKVGRSAFVANHTEVEPKEAAELVEKALSEGIDETKHSQIIDQTRAAIRACAEDLAASIENG